MTDQDKCYYHDDSECSRCPYYEYTVDWENGTNKGRFWVGQEVSLRWGTFGDGVRLTPHMQSGIPPND
jgi:hypothetical protein